MAIWLSWAEMPRDIVHMGFHGLSRPAVSEDIMGHTPRHYKCELAAACRQYRLSSCGCAPVCHSFVPCREDAICLSHPVKALLVLH